MKMKLSILTILLFMKIAFASAQTIDDAKRYIFYERYSSAETSIRELLKKDPANAEAWMLLTRINLLQKDTINARKDIAMAPPSIAKDPFFVIANGAIYLNAGNAVEARKAFDFAIEDTKGKDIAVLAAIADLETEAANGDLNYAVEVLDRAIKRDKKNSELYVGLGKAYRKMHKGNEAYKAFKDAIDLDKNAAAYYEIGRIFLTQKNAEMYLENFNQAVAADRQYAPAYYELYEHYLYRDAVKANEYFQLYQNNADKSLQQDYSFTDLLYLNKKYDSAIIAAKRLIQSEGEKVQPRLYKLIAYSYQEKKDSSTALNYMQQYFQNEEDSNFLVKDFETMGILYAGLAGMEDSALSYFKKATSLATEPENKIKYFQLLAQLSRKTKNAAEEAHWLGEIYANDPKANNVTLFNWGLAAFKAQDFQQADSVFGLYTTKYPEQGFGYYWRARANAAIDTAMEQGLAVPYYEKLVAITNTDSLSATDKKWMKEAYGYLAGYEANTQKDYSEAINYFEKLLEIEPTNEQAKRNIEILEKNLESRNKANSGSN